MRNVRLLSLVVLVVSASLCSAEVYRWDNGAVIPGTEGLRVGMSSKLNNKSLEFGDFDGRMLRYATFDESDLDNARFRNALLDFADINRASMVGADFTSANFGEFASVKDSNLTRASLAYITTYVTAFNGSNLEEADVHGANLYRASFANANLRWSNLQDTTWKFSSVSGADLMGADFRGSEFHEPMELSAGIHRNTILPNGDLPGVELQSGERLLVRNHKGGIAIQVSDTFVVDGGLLELVLTGDPWNSTLGLKKGVDVRLGGTLKIGFADGVAVDEQLGRSVRVFDWNGSSIAGSFHVESPYRDYYWDTSALYRDGTVTFALILPEPSGAFLAWCAVSYCATRRIGRHNSISMPLR